jgi:O-acetyl-ADP-ribose deacetylase (regulator of RNase III)
MRLGETDFEVVVADITALKVDAIVNAASAALAGGAAWTAQSTGRPGRGSSRLAAGSADARPEKSA